jgi:hypothetical protein
MKILHDSHNIGNMNGTVEDARIKEFVSYKHRHYRNHNLNVSVQYVSTCLRT